MATAVAFNDNLYKLGGIFVHSSLKLIIFCTMHKVCRLDYKDLNTILHSAVQGLIHIVDLLSVPGLYMVDYDLCSEGPSYIPVRECFLESIL